MKTKIGLLTALCILLSSITAFGQECTVAYIPDNSDAEVYMIGDYYYIGDDTIMKKDGAIITSGKYKFDFNSWQAECFENGYIKVQDKTIGLMGLMNENGEIVTEVKYSDIEVFDEKGEAIAVIQGEKHGVIDKEGNVVIPFDFDYMRRCNHDELFVAGITKYSTDPNADKVVTGTNFGLIDRSGNIVLPIEHNNIQNFDEYGFIQLGGWNSREKGLANDKGEVVLEREYDDIYIYNEGEYIRAVDGLKSYWFDKDGNNLFPQYDGIAKNKELLIIRKDRKVGLAKYDGTIIIECVYDYIDFIINSDLIKLEKGGEIEWANSEGEILEDAKYEDFDPLSYDDVYTLKQNGLWALVLGDKIGQFEYTEVDHSSHYGSMLFCTKQDGSIDAVDCLTGEVIYENVISYNPSSYYADYYYIKDGQTYLITYEKTLKPAWPDKYKYVGEFVDNVAVAKNFDDFWGLINEKGEPITDFKYQSFRFCVGANHGDEVYREHTYLIDNGLVMVMHEGKIGYIDLKGEWVIEPKFGWPSWGIYGYFSYGYARQYLDGKDCYIDKDGNIYEEGRIIYDYNQVTDLYTDYDYCVLHKDGDIEIWNKNTKERIMFSVGNTLYKEDGSFLVDTILKNDNGSLKVRYDYDNGFSVWTEWGRFIIDVKEK